MSVFPSYRNQSLASIWVQWLAFNELSLSRDNIWILMTRGLNNIWVLIIPETLKYEFGAWQDAVSISWAGESLFSLDWQTPRDGVSKNTGPHHHIGWHQEWHLVIKFCYDWICKMTKSIEKLNCITGSRTFQSEDVMHSSTSAGCRPSQTVIQRRILESKFVNLQVFRANVRTLRGNSGE